MKLINQTTVSIDEKFRSLIKAHKYEDLVQAIIYKSKKIFKGLNFIHVDDQSNGESDFIDNNGQLYDAKLLLNEKQGALIGEEKNEITEWLNVLLDEKNEFAHCIWLKDLSLVKETGLYAIMRERLLSVKPNEHAIFFIPHPIVDEHTDSIYLQFATDNLQAVYDQLKREGMIEKP